MQAGFLQAGLLERRLFRCRGWCAGPYRPADRAGNGLDALELVERLQPDLLLTDIHMPFISGTELARQVRELQPFIQIAFLSGYDDLEYAKLGLKYEVISYLLLLVVKDLLVEFTVCSYLSA